VDVNAKDKDGFTPLHHTAWEGHKEVAELLIAAGADVNAKDFTLGRTLLHIAAREGHKEIVELLIAKGADVNAMDKDGNTPLDSAIRHSDLPEAAETADLLRQHGGKTGDWLNADDSIHNAASAGHIEAVKQHLAASADVNAKDSVGWTPLHLAAICDHKETAELIIANGADVNATNDKGTTPLDWAIRYNHPETADLLRQHGGKTGAELKAEGK
jgi:serine/threonine-protein phosphatase 6 regulatory ankyrin repeat subunit A